jgi:PTS system fructose-specific IIC component
VGTIVGALAVTVAKSVGRKPEGDEAPEDAVDLEHAHAATGVHTARPAAA